MTAVTRDDFTKSRTPTELAEYVKSVYERIASDRELSKAARLRKEPYKTFVEELSPFSNFCTWKYGGRKDVRCALLSESSRCGTPGYDAVVVQTESGTEHIVEITWPIDGEKMIEQAREVNEGGQSSPETWDYEDISKQEDAKQRVLDIAQKKSLRDYRSPGGSSIIFVFDHWLFWDDNPSHVAVLEQMVAELKSISLQVDHVLLMLVFGDQKRIIEVK